MRVSSWVAWFVWPLIVSGPIILSNVRAWPQHETGDAHSPLGLGLGLASVAVGHVFVVLYCWLQTRFRC